MMDFSFWLEPWTVIIETHLPGTVSTCWMGKLSSLA